MTRVPIPVKQRNWLPCGCLVVLGLGCLLVPAVTWMAWRIRASADVEARLAEIRGAGLPTNSEELYEFYQLEAGAEDATLHYLAAQRKFSGNEFQEDCRDLPIIGTAELEIPPPGEPWPEQQAVEDFLKKYDEGLEQLHAAAAKGGAAQFPLHFEEGFQMLLPHAQEMRNCARILALEAHVKAHQGDAAGAARSILTLGTIGNGLENQPIMISQLVVIAIKSIARDVTARLLPYVEFSDQDLVRLQQMVRQDDFKQRMAYSLIGERAIGAEAFQGPLAPMGANNGMPQTRLVHGSKEDLAFFLEVETDLIKALEQDYPEALDAVEQVDEKLQAKVAKPLGRLRYALTTMTLPSVAAAASAAARGDGSTRALDAAIAVERFRRATGVLPESLGDLVPEYLAAVPIDPFDGQPIRYVILQDCYLLYTCGRNRTDDGGLDDDSQTDDVIRIDLKPKTHAPHAVPGTKAPTGGVDAKSGTDSDADEADECQA